MKRQTLFTLAATTLFTLALAFSTTEASAQSAGSWVDIGRGGVGSGANASGMFQIAKSRSSKKNGVGFGHGFALGAGPNGLALSNSIGVGGGPAGAAHNVQLNIGRNGTHFSQGGVVSQGGNRRVISGGQAGTTNGQIYGGSYSTGYGQNTRAYSKSHTRQFGGPNSGQVYQNQPTRSTGYFPSQNRSRSTQSRGRVIRGGMRMFGR